MSCLAIPSNLGAILGFVKDSCTEAGLDEDISFAVRLAGEEACSNIINHAYVGVEPGPISLDLHTESAQVVLVIEDCAPLFSPGAVPDPDLTGDWEHRRMGGLGWHLLTHVMDEVRHQPLTGGGNRLEMVKRLPVESKH